MARMLAGLAILMLSVGCGQSGSNAATSNTGSLPFIATPVATLDSPWAMTFLPDGRVLVTEKAGKLLIVSSDGHTRKAVLQVPQVDSEGQGGLMDVLLHPRFAENRLVYLSYSEALPDGRKGVALARARLDWGNVTDCMNGDGTDCSQREEALWDLKVIFRATPYVEGNGHYSGRIAFSPDGFLFFTNGERQKFNPAQDKGSTLGKVLRLTEDGGPAPDNLPRAQGFHPAVWSYGHRNLLGIAFDAKGQLWETEMGPRGGDELDLVVKGRNYGWPVVSNGNHYDGRDIPDHKTRPEFEAPKISWNPVISPSSLMIYSGDLFPQWKGNAFIGGLSSKALVRIAFDGANAREAERFPMDARIREVEQGPDGAIWLLEDGESGGRLLKLTPAGR